VYKRNQVYDIYKCISVQLKGETMGLFFSKLLTNIFHCRNQHFWFLFTRINLSPSTKYLSVKLLFWKVVKRQEEHYA